MPRRNIKKLSEYGSDKYDIWAMDEVLFQQIGSRCRMWIAPESKRPVSIQHPGRKCVGYFGAVRIRDGKFIYSREEDKFNAETSWAFLRKVEEQSRIVGKAVVLIIDNARYHHAKMHKAWREEVCSRFRLEFLPPYSPELNPIERVWRLTRRKRLHNQYFPTLESLRDAAESLFETWATGSDDLRRLCRI